MSSAILCPSKRVVDHRGTFRPQCPDGTRPGQQEVLLERDLSTGSCTFTTEDTCERTSAGGEWLGPNEAPCQPFLDGRPGCGVVAFSDARVWIAFASVVAVGAGLYWAMRR